MSTSRAISSLEFFKPIPAEQETADSLHTRLIGLIQHLEILQNYLVEHAASHRYLKRVLVKTGGKLVIVQCSDMDWIEAWGDYIRIHCKGKQYLVRQKISVFEMRLDTQQFIRINRSAIINVDHIKEMEPLNHGDYLITMNDSTQLNLSRNYREHLTVLFDHHI